MATGEPYWHWSSETIDAYRCQGLKEGSLHDGATLKADATSINGVTSLQAGTGSYARGHLQFTGLNNTPGTATISMGGRYKFRTPGSAMGLLGTGGPFRNLYNWLNLSLGTATLNTDTRNNLAQTCTNTTYAHSLTTATWYDILWTWDGTTGANGMKLYIDNSNVASYTSARTNNVVDANVRAYIVIGITENGYSADFDCDEAFIYDSVIDPNAVTFRDSTTGALDGAARTKYLFSTAYEGGAVAAAGGGGGTINLGGNRGGFSI